MSAAELILATGTPPSPPESGRVTLYAAETGELYCIGADGEPRQLATSSGATLRLADVTLTAPRSGTFALKAGTPTAGQIAYWQDADVLAASSIRTSSSGAMGIGMEVAHNAAGNLDVAGSAWVHGDLEAKRLTTTDPQAGTRLVTINNSSAVTEQNIVAVTLDSSSDAVLLRIILLHAGSDNAWGYYTGYAAAWYSSSGADSSASLIPEHVNGSLLPPRLRWQGSGTTRTLTLENAQSYSLLVAWVRLASRLAAYVWS